jgi:hypothetical protein
MATYAISVIGQCLNGNRSITTTLPRLSLAESRMDPSNWPTRIATEVLASILKPSVKRSV